MEAEIIYPLTYLYLRVYNIYMRGYPRPEKDEAIALRKKGISMTVISKKFGIRKSTLSFWFSEITLTEKQKEALKNSSIKNLHESRKFAVAWHNKQKADRLEIARTGALEFLSSDTVMGKEAIELALAFLYLGEGSKKKVETAMGNSDSRVLRFFVWCLRNLYKIDEKKIMCDLYLRADQDGKAMQKYWARELSLSLTNFRYVHHDIRTKGIKTYENYHGVCSINCGTVAIQRRLVYISTLYCDKIAPLAQW